MARVAVPARWVGALARQRGPLRTYQWLWLLCCTLGALAVAAPRILSRPVIYTSRAAVATDAARHRELFNGGPNDPDFAAVREIAVNLLRQQRDAAGQPLYAALGSPTLGVAFTPQADGTVAIATVGADTAQAQRLADDAAEALARSIRAAGGREIFRRLSGWEQYAAFAGAPPRDPFQQALRTIALTSAFPLNRPVDIERAPFTVDQLMPEDVSDLARALEVRNLELSREELPALRAARAAAAGEDRERLDKDVARLEDGLRAIRSALETLYGPPFNAAFDPDAASSAYRSQRAAPGALVDPRTGLLLGLAAALGLAFGAAGVAVDRSAGVMRKAQELWAYRELIRNLVLRDLRVRYKGSVLGYLWTQLAPLLMMLVFVIVFTLLLPSGIAMYSVFLIVALLPWNYCAEAVTGGARSVIDNANVIKKVFFPREVLPLVSVCSALVNYILSLPMMVLVMIIAQSLYPPLRELGRLNLSWTFLYLPVLIGIQTLFLAGLALFLSALAVSFRDLTHLVGILVQFWFFLTPVVYSLNALAVSEWQARLIRWLNPMASLIEFYREVLYGTAVPVGAIPTPGLPGLDSVLRVLLTAVVVLAGGYWFFQRRSGRFGEEI
jgi:lipopolysaccharide transport system permease protein